jgi:hypothetical protein
MREWHPPCYSRVGVVGLEGEIITMVICSHTNIKEKIETEHSWLIQIDQVRLFLPSALPIMDLKRGPSCCNDILDPRKVFRVF